jgi:hypothetical protein
MQVSWLELVFCWWDGVWVGEGENEAIRMCFESATAVPWNRRITTKEESLVAANNGECGSFVVTVFVKIFCCEPISKMVVLKKKKERRVRFQHTVMLCKGV